MSPAIIFLAVICIWPADNTQPPRLAYGLTPSKVMCESTTAEAKAKLEADPTVRYVNASCVELVQGNKA